MISGRIDLKSKSVSISPTAVVPSCRRRQRENYRTLADALPQKVWIAATDGTAIDCNAQMESYHGPVGSGIADRIALTHPDDA